MASCKTDWSEEEEVYLIELSKLSQYLSQRYNSTYLTYKEHQTRTRLPQLVLSSGASLVSFATPVFPKEYHNTVNISVGVIAMVVALISSIEGVLKIPEIIAGSLQASTSFLKLAESIGVELALPRRERTASGLLFLRESYKTYEKHIETAPNVFKHIRFIKPFKNKRFDLEEIRSEEPTPSSIYNGRSLDETNTSPGIEGDSPAYVPIDGYALRAPRPPTAIDLPV